MRKIEINFLAGILIYLQLGLTILPSIAFADPPPQSCNEWTESGSRLGEAIKKAETKQMCVEHLTRGVPFRPMPGQAAHADPPGPTQSNVERVTSESESFRNLERLFRESGELATIETRESWRMSLLRYMSPSLTILFGGPPAEMIGHHHLAMGIVAAGLAMQYYNFRQSIHRSQNTAYRSGRDLNCFMDGVRRYIALEGAPYYANPEQSSRALVARLESLGIREESTMRNLGRWIGARLRRLRNRSPAPVVETLTGVRVDCGSVIREAEVQAAQAIAAEAAAVSEADAAIAPADSAAQEGAQGQGTQRVAQCLSIPRMSAEEISTAARGIGPALNRVLFPATQLLLPNSTQMSEEIDFTGGGRRSCQAVSGSAVNGRPDEVAAPGAAAGLVSGAVQAARVFEALPLIPAVP